MPRLPALKLTPTTWTRPASFELRGDAQGELWATWSPHDPGVPVGAWPEGPAEPARHGRARPLRVSADGATTAAEQLLDRFSALVRERPQAKPDAGRGARPDAGQEGRLATFVRRFGCWDFCSCGRSHPRLTVPAAMRLGPRRASPKQGSPVREATGQYVPSMLESARKVNALRALAARLILRDPDAAPGWEPPTDPNKELWLDLWPRRLHGRDLPTDQRQDLFWILNGWARTCHLDIEMRVDGETPRMVIAVGGLAGAVVWSLFEEIGRDLWVRICATCGTTFRMRRSTMGEECRQCHEMRRGRRRRAQGVQGGQAE